MTKSPGGWAPWISDPDPPEEPWTEEQSKVFARKSRELMDRIRREEAEAAKQAPAPSSEPADAPKELSGETKPKQSVAELYRKAGFRELPPSGKGYVIPTGKRPDQRVRPSSKR
jgi:hypothetical protein